MRALRLPVVLFALLGAVPAAAEFPDKPIRLIVPQGGGQCDRHGRAHPRR